MSVALAESVREFGRFFSTTLAGLIVDLSVASSLVIWAGMSDPLAAACGLFVGMIVGYAGHLNWTFRSSGRIASIGHFAQFACGVGISLVVRVTALVLLDYSGAAPYLPTVIRLGSGAGLSFLVSYTLCRFVIFRPLQTDRPHI